MQDIADALGVSKNTVYLVLNEKPGVGAEMRTRVLQAAKEMDYGGLSGVTAPQTLSNILVLMPASILKDTVYYYELYWAIERYAPEFGLTAVLAGVSDSMRESPQLPPIAKELNHSGVLVIGAHEESYIRFLLESRIPVVAVDNYFSGIPLDSVVTANEPCMFRLVNLVLDRGKRTLGFIGPVRQTSSYYERWEGFRHALWARGIENNPKWSHLPDLPQGTDFDEASFFAFLDTLDEYPDCWVCANDDIAIKTIHALQTRGKSVPEDVSVTGFDDIQTASIVRPALTTIRSPRQDIARNALARLSARINGEKGLQSTISLHGELLVRDSLS